MALGDLVVNLTANTVQFTGAMDKASYLAQKNARQMKRDLNQAGRVIGTALVAGATAFGYAMKKIIDDADELGKMSQKIGVSVQSLSAFRHAAELAGSDFEVLTKGVARFTRNISDASVGLATPRRAFEFLNIAIQDASGQLRGTEDLLLEVADRFSKMSDGVKKAALAQELFGRSGVELIPFLNEGKEGIEAIRKEAEALGIVFDEKTAKASENLNDNITRLSAALRGRLVSVATEIVPIMLDFSEQMVKSAKSTDKLKEAGTSLADVLLGLITVGNYVTATYKTMGNAVKNYAAGWVLVARGQFDKLKELSLSAADEMVGNFEEAAKKTQGIFQKNFLREAGFDTEGVGRSAKDIENSFNSLSENMKALQKEGEALKKSLRMPKEVLHDDLQNYKKLLDAGAISQDTYSRAVEKTTKEFAEQSEKIKETDGFMKSLGTTFSSAFEDAIVDGKKFSDILYALEKDLLRIFIRLKVTEPLMKSLFQNSASSGFNLSSIFGSLFSSGGGYTYAGTASTGTDLASQVQAYGGGINVPSARGNAFLGGNLIPFASGGILNGPIAFPLAGRKTGVAGEAGPEAILPLMRTPGGDLGVKSSGGNKVEVNVYAPPGSEVKEERQDDGSVERINVFIDEAVAGNMRPGTKTYRAMRSTFGISQRLNQR